MRFVQCTHSGHEEKWGHHRQVVRRHHASAREIDKPPSLRAAISACSSTRFRKLAESPIRRGIRMLRRDLRGCQFGSITPNFIIRGIQQGDPIQDTWDFLTNRVTTIFLGIQTQCVSCHDGAGHLEPINLYLRDRQRTDFMRLSAFFSRVNVFTMAVDAYGQQAKGIIVDRSTGVLAQLGHVFMAAHALDGNVGTRRSSAGSGESGTLGQ